MGSDVSGKARCHRPLPYPQQQQHGASRVAQTVKNLPAMRDTWVRSLEREDLLEKGLATHSNLLAWRILWTEDPGSTGPFTTPIPSQFSSGDTWTGLLTP